MQRKKNMQKRARMRGIKRGHYGFLSAINNSVIIEPPEHFLQHQMCVCRVVTRRTHAHKMLA